MSSSALGSLVYLAAAGVYIVLRYQSAVHKREIALEYLRLGLTRPPARPRIEVLEAILTVTIGVIVSLGSAGMLIIAGGDPVARRILDPANWAWYSVFLAGGLTLVLLGGRAILESFRGRRGAARRGHGISPRPSAFQ